MTIFFPGSSQLSKNLCLPCIVKSRQKKLWGFLQCINSIIWMSISSVSPLSQFLRIFSVPLRWRVWKNTRVLGSIVSILWGPGFTSQFIFRYLPCSIVYLNFTCNLQQQWTPRYSGHSCSSILNVNINLRELHILSHSHFHLVGDTSFLIGNTYKDQNILI